MTRIVVEINRGEVRRRECGRCDQIIWGLDTAYCRAFTTRAFRLPRQLRRVGGAPQRCSQCLAAEVKTEVPNG
jgi:ribosomal protein L34E